MSKTAFQIKGTDQQTNKILSFCKELPDCCQSFLLETGTETAKSTRLAYARELDYFFDYMIYSSPVFCDITKTDITREMVAKISSQDISRYLTYCKDQGMKERTVARKRAALSSFFAYLTANRIIEFNPVNAAVRVKIHQSDEVLHLDIEEQIVLLDAVSSGEMLSGRRQKYHERYKSRDYSLILLLLDTGMRVSELQGAGLGDLDIDKCLIMVTRKGGDRQTLYFSNETAEALSEYLCERNSKGPTSVTDPLFTSLKGERLTIRAIENIVKKYSVTAIPGKGANLSPHKMRSSFAMGYYEAERDILALQRKLGHKSLAATNIYAKATDKKMKETRSVMEAARAKARESE